MTEDLIFGRTWEEIQAMQNGTYKPRTVDMSKSGKREPTERDRALLAEHGVAGLLEKKFLGTLDALDLMYSPVYTVLEEGQVWHCRDGSRVKLDRRVPGDGTKWYVQDWWDGSWACMDNTVEPGDLLARE